MKQKQTQRAAQSEHLIDVGDNHDRSEECEIEDSLCARRLVLDQRRTLSTAESRIRLFSPPPHFPNGAEARNRTNNTSYSYRAGATFLLQNVGATTCTMCRGLLAFRVSEVVLTSVQPCVHGEPLALRLAAKKTP